MLIDVGFEALIGNIHLTETCKDLVGAGVVVFGDVGLQFFYKCLSLGRVSGVPVIHTFGEFGKNCVQAIARDCLADTIERLEAAHLPVVFHVHDEVIIDVTPWADEDTMLEYVCSIMRQPIPWAPELPLNADGWVGQFFRKD